MYNLIFNSWTNHTVSKWICYNLLAFLIRRCMPLLLLENNSLNEKKTHTNTLHAVRWSRALFAHTKLLNWLPDEARPKHFAWRGWTYGTLLYIWWWLDGGRGDVDDDTQYATYIYIYMLRAIYTHIPIYVVCLFDT